MAKSLMTVDLLESYLYWQRRGFPDFEKSCSICKNYIDKIVKDNGEYYYCICFVREETRRIRGIAGSPSAKSKFDSVAPFKGCTNDEIVSIRNFKKAIAGFLQNPHWMLIMGTYGTGKTQALFHIKEKLPISLYISAGDFENRIFSSLKGNELTEMVADIQGVPILLLDDIGAEHGGDLFKSVLQRIIDHRYTYPDRLVTVCTSNLNSTDLYQYLGRTASRLLDGNVELVSLKSRDFRKMRIV